MSEPICERERCGHAEGWHIGIDGECMFCVLGDVEPRCRAFLPRLTGKEREAAQVALRALKPLPRRGREAALGWLIARYAPQLKQAGGHDPSTPDPSSLED